MCIFLCFLVFEGVFWLIIVAFLACGLGNCITYVHLLFPENLYCSKLSAIYRLFINKVLFSSHGSLSHPAEMNV